MLLGVAGCTHDTTIADTKPPGTTATPPNKEPVVIIENAPANEAVSNREFNLYSAHDTNADGQLNNAEFNAHLKQEGVYQNWHNKSGQLTQVDFNAGIFARWDANQDGQLDPKEYTAGNAMWKTQYGNNFSVWDTNRDNLLTSTEFNNGINETGIYTKWDSNRDGTISQSEFNEGTFNAWDTNGDNHLSSEELNAVNARLWYGTGLRTQFR